MNVQDITGGSTWAIASTAFSNPMYLNSPLGKTDNSVSTGFQITPGAAVVIGFEGTYSGATVAHEQTMDPDGLVGWFSVEGSPSTGGSATSTGSTSGVAYVFTCIGVLHRIKVTALSTGTIEARIRLEGEAISTSGGGGGAGGDVNLTEIAGNAVTTGAGAVALGTQRTTLASNDPAVAALQAMQAATGPVLAPSAATLVNGNSAELNDTNAAAVSGMGAPGSGLYNYITEVTIGNSNATVGTMVELLDGAAGSVIRRFPAAANYGGASVTLPVPIKQPTANTALYCRCMTATPTDGVYVGVSGYTGA